MCYLKSLAEARHIEIDCYNVIRESQTERGYKKQEVVTPKRISREIIYSETEYMSVDYE